MPFITRDSGNLHYQFDGPADAPVLVLSNSLGTNFSLWDRQIPALTRHFRILRYDTRGHGQSLVTPGPYSIELLGRDLLHLLNQLHIARAHICGVSLGGMTAMWLAIHTPSHVDRVVIANSTASIPMPDVWDKRIVAVRAGGMQAVAEGVVERWFTPAFRSANPGVTTQTRQMLLASPPEGYIACCAAIRDMDQRAGLPSIHARTLVITGDADPATPPELGRQIAHAIPGARYLELHAAHLSNIESAQPFNDAVTDFLLA